MLLSGIMSASTEPTLLGAAHERITVEFLPPYSPFINPIEEFFSVWRWKVCDNRPQDQMSLLGAMNAVCEDITADHCRGWRFPPTPNPPPPPPPGAWQWKTSDLSWWKSLAWPTRATGCPPWIFFFIDVILYFCVFLVTINIKCTVIG